MCPLHQQQLEFSSPKLSLSVNEYRLQKIEAARDKQWKEGKWACKGYLSEMPGEDDVDSELLLHAGPRPLSN